MGEVERVVRDHEVGLAGALARRLGEARRDERAAAARAAVGADGELGPERLGRLELELGPVAGLGLVEPALHRLPGAARRGRRPAGTAGSPAAGGGRGSSARPFSTATVHLAPERRRGDRHVLREQLLLERLRRRRDDDAPPRLERRHQVREALPDPGARLGDEVLARRERVLDRAPRARPARGRGSYSGRARASAPPGPKTSSIAGQPTRANGRSPRRRRRRRKCALVAAIPAGAAA